MVITTPLLQCSISRHRMRLTPTILLVEDHMKAKLNEAKSKCAGTARNNTVVYEAAGDQTKVTVDGVDENGNAVHHEWTGKFDGKDYPVTGDAGSDTRSYRMINKNTLELTAKKGGKVTLTGRVVVSSDGKTRTVTTNSTNAQGKKVTNVVVYDRQ